MAKKTTTTTSKKTKPKGEVTKSQSKILKNLAQRLSDDYYPSHNYSDSKEGSNGDPEIQKMNRIINASVEKISGKKVQKSDKKLDKEAKPSFDPANFNGISDPKEERTLFIEQIKHLERENSKFKHELELLHEDFQKEKTTLKKTVRELKNELHRTTPLTDNKLFSFSKELRQVASSVEALSDQERKMFSSETQEESQPEELTMPEVSIEKPITSPNQTPEPKEIKKVPEQKLDANKEEKNEKKIKLSPKKIKLSKNQKVIGGATAGLLLAFLTLGAVLSNSSKVDNKIVEEYIEEQNQGQVQGVTDSTAYKKKPDQRHNNVSFEEVEWEMFRDEFIGFQAEYPTNAVDLLHTGNTLTFLRYDGYIYKMQRLSSEETIQEYYERTKGDGLQYLEEEVLWNDIEALHLTLQEEIEFPGNRYIVSNLGSIYDIWYASQSAQLNADDIKMVEKMLSTTRFP